MRFVVTRHFSIQDQNATREPECRDICRRCFLIPQFMASLNLNTNRVELGTVSEVTANNLCVKILSKTIMKFLRK